ncbi:MAG: methionine ABC transporter ATP-binding protein [Firmicutes bacterium]|nr:methionine ABC transporter ATP-binding protein [Bacillota bacterium]
MFSRTVFVSSNDCPKGVTILIELQHVSKSFRTEKAEVEAVKDVSLKIETGDIFGIIGLSGAGKSTLVRIMNYLEIPTSGKVLFKGVDLSSLKKNELLQTRRSISMIFQNFNLLAQRNALKNVCYPLEIAGVSKKESLEKAKKLLEIVGLSDRMFNYPAQLSGGQKQRVAIARALATDPEVLLCDEATSALDPNTTSSILSLLKSINESMGVTIVVITHEMKVVEQICNKVAVLDGGSVAETGLVKDIFVAPQSDIAKELILPKSSAVTEVSGKTVIRIVFDGQSSFEPVISNLSLECRTAVNILGADTKNIGGKAYGQMLLQLPDDENAIVRIKKYLDSRNIHFEEVDSNERIS